MREAQIVMPTSDAIDRRVHAALRSDLVQAFEGVTVTTGHGVWHDPAPGGRTYHDDLILYTVAMEPTVGNDAKLDEIAFKHGLAASQAAVYVRHASGEVVIIDLVGERKIGAS